MKFKPYDVLSEETLFDHPYCQVRKQRVQFPDGKEGDWFLSADLQCVIMIPVTKSGKILLIRDYRHGAQATLTQFCAGTVDDGESLETAARRELLEETGFSAEKFIPLGTAFSDANRSQQKHHFFLATEAKKTAEPALDSAEQIESFLVKNWEKAKQEITNSSTQTSGTALAGIALVDRYFSEK